MVLSSIKVEKISCFDSDVKKTTAANERPNNIKIVHIIGCIVCNYNYVSLITHNSKIQET